MITMEWVRWIVFLVLTLAYFTSLVFLIRGDIAIRRARRAALRFTRTGCHPGSCEAPSRRSSTLRSTPS